MVCSCRLCCLCSVGVSGHLCGVKRFVYAFVPLVLHGFVRDGGARSFFFLGLCCFNRMGCLLFLLCFLWLVPLVRTRLCFLRLL